MNPISKWVFLVSFLFLVQSTRPQLVGLDVKTALLNFLVKLSTKNEIPNPSWGWNSSSDPCKDHWKGVYCDDNNVIVEELHLDDLKFGGTFDPSIICSVQSLADNLNVISLNENSLDGENLDDISCCKYLSSIHLHGNRFSGSILDSMSRLSSLKVLDISNNNVSGFIPEELANISGLTEFLAQNNDLSGAIPSFNFSSFEKFNVSNNSLSGPIPYGGTSFPASAFLYNPKLCGAPLPDRCPSVPPPLAGKSMKSQPVQQDVKSKNGVYWNQILMFSGYFLLGLFVVLLVMYKFCRKGKKKQERVMLETGKNGKGKKKQERVMLETGKNGKGKKKQERVMLETGKNVVDVDDTTSIMPSIMTADYKNVAKKAGVSDVSADSGGMISSSLVVLSSPEVSGLELEDLLSAPAELLGRGKHGSVYKVNCEDKGVNLVVKRIKDSTLVSMDFKKRMERLDQVRHPNVLSPVAFYSSGQEKLIVYEYQHNGSLYKLLHGDQKNQGLDWSIRIGVAARVADALAFMHEELQEDRIAHGNLKSSNILLDQNMEACISEYGLMMENQELSIVSGISSSVDTPQAHQSVFKSDIYAFGVILLEMLTGKVAAELQNHGLDLAKWVVSVVREEWTVEVFDRRLIREGASEERMVNLLQIAIKCVNSSPEARPNIKQVALMINTLKEEDERSMDISDSLNL